MPPLLCATGISKSFPGVQALASVNLHIQPGEILAVVGENGAGKSTLMKILAGVYTADAGAIEFDGRAVAIGSVKEAEALGIAIIHQELNLVGHLDIAGNIFLGREPTWAGILIDRRRIHDDASHIINRLGLTASPRTLVHSLSIGQQQLVEIARALSLKSRLLILDEPTSSLTESETERLFGVLNELRRDGISILYISHRLKEVETIADRVLVLRDGKNAGELQRGNIHHQAIVHLMVGRELKQFFQRHRGHTETAPPVAELFGVRWSSAQAGIDFAIRAGEIVGMAGLMGSGRTELAETLFGVRAMVTGSVQIDGKPIALLRPADAIRAGIFLIPEDRRLDGLILTDSVKHNVSLARLPLLSRLGFLKSSCEEELAQSMCERFKVRTPGTMQMVSNLSGGNQQKVVLAKWLSQTPRLLILDEPTRGIDVSAKSEIYALMDELARQGAAILMISSDLEEILGMSDRVLVMHQGGLAGALMRAEISEEAIMHLATGGRDPLMKKLLGIFIFLMILYVSVVLGTPAEWGALTDADWRALQSNHKNLGQRIGLEGILCLGAGLLIITGGIDLSIGSVVCLCACVFCKLVLVAKVPIPLAALLVVMLGGFIGFVNGVLVTYFHVQAFVVTLCGLFIYRGAARWITRDEVPEIANAVAPISEFCRGSILYVPVYLWILLTLFAITTVFLHLTIYGRYFYAIGSNERAARYSGINTNFYKILAYVLCSMFASIFSLVHVVHYNTVEPPTTGAFMELYAIAGAVLGGCSLRGGEGTSLGMLIGTAIMKLLPNFTNMWEIPSTLEPTVIGVALLFCAILDEMLQRGVRGHDVLSAVSRFWARWFG